jgi:hypothetical protein
MTGLIIEPVRSGHRLAYLVELVGETLDRGIDIMVAVGNDVSGDEIAARLRADVGALDGLQIIRVPVPADNGTTLAPLGRVVSAYRWWRFLKIAHRAASEARTVDFVFVPYLDTAIWAVSVFGSPFGATPFGGISMAQRFHFHEMGVSTAPQSGSELRKWLFFRLLHTKGLRELFVIDETLEDFVRRRRPELGSKVRFLPDPSAPPKPIAKHDARDALGLRRDVLLIVAYGSLDRRKDIATLLDWVAAADQRCNVEVLLAGRVLAEVEDILNSDSARRLRQQQRLILLRRYIEDLEESLIFSAADVIWVAYDAIDSMSGVLVKAALYEKAVLYRNYGLIGRYATRRGRPVSPLDFGLPALPGGVDLCAFARGSSADPLPDHSWRNACDEIFGRRE